MHSSASTLKSLAAILTVFLSATVGEGSGTAQVNVEGRVVVGIGSDGAETDQMPAARTPPLMRKEPAAADAAAGEAAAGQTGDLFADGSGEDLAAGVDLASIAKGANGNDAQAELQKNDMALQVELDLMREKAHKTSSPDGQTVSAKDSIQTGVDFSTVGSLLDNGVAPATNKKHVAPGSSGAKKAGQDHIHESLPQIVAGLTKGAETLEKELKDSHLDKFAKPGQLERRASHGRHQKKEEDGLAAMTKQLQELAAFEDAPLPQTAKEVKSKLSAIKHGTPERAHAHAHGRGQHHSTPAAEGLDPLDLMKAVANW